MNLKDLKFLFDDRVSDSRITLILGKPNFEGAGKVHDWRNYIPYGLKKKWSELSIETRYCLYKMAEHNAWGEEWD